MAGYGIAGALIAGVLFGTAWWLFIDGCAHSNDLGGVNTVEFLDSLPMTGATIFFFMLVSFGWERLEAEDFEYSGCSNVSTWARICLFFDIMIGFGSCIGSGILFTTRWMQKEREPYFGVMQLIGTILIFISAVVWRVARNATIDSY